jgi:hypothetical protein
LARISPIGPSGGTPVGGAALAATPRSNRLKPRPTTETRNFVRLFALMMFPQVRKDLLPAAVAKTWTDGRASALYPIRQFVRDFQLGLLRSYYDVNARSR